MKYNISWLFQLMDAGERLKYIFFWGHQPDKNGKITTSCLSQWWQARFEENGTVYETAEHYMMAAKARLFGDHKTLELILNSRSPAESKKLGREVQHFDQAVWEKERFAIVVQANYCKFSQNELLKEFLLNTKDRILVEASPIDTIWGIGLPKDSKIIEDPWQWRGLNLLGFALMEVRDRLNQNDF